MSEMKDLQQEAERQYAAQRFQELGDYMEQLFRELHESHVAGARHGIFLMATMCAWFASIFGYAYAGGTIMYVVNEFAHILFLAMIAREWLFILPYRFGKIDELRGCLKTLELLGMIDRRDNGNRRLKKYRESWMYKLWEALKSQQMRKAFA